MTDERSNRLTGAAKAGHLRDQLALADAHTPDQHVATDHSGFVHVMIGRDGLPDAFEVVAGWERWLAPEEFGDAVEQAYRMAMIERMVSWSAALDEVISPDSELAPELPADPPATGVDLAGNGGNGLGTGTTGGAGGLDDTGGGEPRPSSQLIEELHQLVGKTGQLFGQRALTAEGTGHFGTGSLVLKLSKTGGISCHADPRWVAKQTAASLMNALGQALADARADLASAEQAAQAPIERLMQLCTESIARLSHQKPVANS